MKFRPVQLHSSLYRVSTVERVQLHSSLCRVSTVERVQLHSSLCRVSPGEYVQLHSSVCRVSTGERVQLHSSVCRVSAAQFHVFLSQDIPLNHFNLSIHVVRPWRTYRVSAVRKLASFIPQSPQPIHSSITYIIAYYSEFILISLQINNHVLLQLNRYLVLI